MLLIRYCSLPYKDFETRAPVHKPISLLPATFCSLYLTKSPHNIRFIKLQVSETILCILSKSEPQQLVPGDSNPDGGNYCKLFLRLIVIKLGNLFRYSLVDHLSGASAGGLLFVIIVVIGPASVWIFFSWSKNQTLQGGHSEFRFGSETDLSAHKR